MGFASLKRLRGTALIALAALLCISVLLLLARSVENSSQFSRWQPSLVAINLIGVVVLAVLVARKLWQLAREYRQNRPGSRMTVRTVLTFGTLVVAPLLVVYLFSLAFLNSGIDSWFQIDVRQGLNEALVQSRSALEHRMREQGQRTEELARSLTDRGAASLPSLLDAERRRSGALEIIVFGRRGEVLASSSQTRETLLDLTLPQELLLQMSNGRAYSNLEPLGTGSSQITTAAPLQDTANVARGRFVVVRDALPEQLANLTNAVERAYQQYGELTTYREPLKYSFRLTLTLVLLLSMLSAIYLAVQSAQRLARPVHDLMQGTRAVGQGDFATRIKLSSHDEMGFLVQSFNDMTKRLRRASDEATRSRDLVEQERERLSVILAGLSSGVLVLDRELKLRIVNAAAVAILDRPLATLAGLPLDQWSSASPRVAAFAEQVTKRLAGSDGQWQEEFALPPDRVLRCACAPLAEGAGEPGHVIVFDDITHLLNAQRDAAWGEVARRLAHEIKNPLTPIQLAAERLQSKLAGHLGTDDAALLERATHTIVQQVEALKSMVNAFSEYARAPELKFGRVDLNTLVNEVLELYRSQAAGVALKAELDASLPAVAADRSRLRQVLNNLIANGLEAVEGLADGAVTVSSARERIAGREVAVVSVTDNGPGFQQELLARVFEPYVTSKTRGTGLGLAIVKKIAEEHGGNAEAHNRGARGAIVRVTLPLRELS